MKLTKPIEITFKDGNKKYYGSIREASRSLNIPAPAISTLLNGCKSNIANIRELTQEETELINFKRL